MNAPLPDLLPPQGGAGDARRVRARSVAAFAAALLIALTFVSYALRHDRPVDADQYYMGGVIAASGDWQSLYPDPLPNATLNLGYPEASRVRPGYAGRAAERGVPPDAFRFAGPPPLALLFAPLALLDVRPAEAVWCLLMAVCYGVCAWQAGRIFDLCVFGAQGGPSALRLSRLRPILVPISIIAVCCLPRPLLGLRMGNISPLIACFAFGAILALVRHRPVSAAVLTGFGGMPKMTTVVWIPLLIATGEWLGVAALAMGGVLSVALLLPIVGVDPFRRYVVDVIPSLALPTPHWTNQSLFGVATVFTTTSTQLAVVWRVLSVVRLAVFAALLALAVVRRRALRNPEGLVCAAAGLLAALQLFGPITWGHYSILFLPVAGWLMARLLCGTGVWKVAAVAAGALLFVPWNGLPLPTAGGAVLRMGSFSLGLATLLALSVVRLICVRDGSGRAARGRDV